MSQPVADAASWWSNLSTEQFSMIVESALDVSRIDEALGAVPDPEGGVTTLEHSSIPSNVESVFAGRTALYRAYLTAFRGWVESHPAPGDDDASGLVAQWSMLTSPRKSLSADDRKLRSRLLARTQNRYTEFRRELITICTNINRVMNDEKITGKRKDGRLVLDHSGDTLVKHGGKNVYRTPEGYLAHKRALTAVTGGSPRAREDFKIMINRAVRYTQAKAATDAVMAELRQRIRKQDAAHAWRTVQAMRKLVVELLTQCWSDDFRSGLLAAYETWSKAAMPENWKFAEVPSYAEGRILGSVRMLQTRQGELREFNARFLEFDRAVPQTGNNRFWQDEDTKKTVTALLTEARTSLQNFIDAYQAVYDAEVDSSTKFYEWLCDWTVKQKKIGFRTEHQWIWLGLKAAKVSMMTAALGAKITLTVLSMGTALAITTPLFLGANALMDRFEKWSIDHVTKEDMKELDRRAKASEFIGEKYVTAGERAFAGVYELYTKVRASESDDLEAHEKADTLGEVREKIMAAEELRERLAVGGETLDAILGRLNDAEQYEKAHEVLENFKHFVDPVSKAGDTADFATNTGAAGFKLTLEVVGDGITLVVPPQRRTVIGDDGIAALEEALNVALRNMDDDEVHALTGWLRQGKVHLNARFALSGRRISATIVDNNDQPYQVRVDEELLRPQYVDRLQVLKGVLAGPVGKQTAAWWPASLPARQDDEVYALHVSCNRPKDPYDADDPAQTAIVAFLADDLVDLFTGREEADRGFVIHGVDGRMVPSGLLRDNYTVYVDVTGVVKYEGESHPPKPTARERVRKAKKAVAVEELAATLAAAERKLGTRDKGKERVH